MKKTIVAIMLTLTCITTLTVGCAEKTTTKKEQTKKEQTVTKEQTANNKKDSKEEIKMETYYVIQDGVSTYVQANFDEPTPRVFHVNDEVKIFGEETNGFRKISFGPDIAIEYVESKFIAKEKVSTSASAVPTTPGIAPTTPTTPTTPTGTTTPKPSSSTSTTNPSTSTPTTKPSTSTPTTKPSTPAPKPAPAPAPAPAPIPTYVPLPAGWNHYKSVCKPDTCITPEQKVQIDAWVEAWIKTPSDGFALSESATLRMKIIQYLYDNGNFGFRDVSVNKVPSVIFTNIENQVLTSAGPFHYIFRATYSTGVKPPYNDATVCAEYNVSID